MNKERKKRNQNRRKLEHARKEHKGERRRKVKEDIRGEAEGGGSVKVERRAIEVQKEKDPPSWEWVWKQNPHAQVWERLMFSEGEAELQRNHVR